MTLNEYIKQSYLRPNIQVLKSLGASDELITYLFKTPWNTNINIVTQLVGSDMPTPTAAVVGTAIIGISTVG